MPAARVHHTIRWRAAVVALLGLLSAAWTAGVVLGWFDGFDARLRNRSLDPLSPTAQIFAGIAIVSYPAVTYLAAAGAAWWAWQRRLRKLAWACVLAIPVAWGLAFGLKHLVARARPDAPTSVLLTARGYSYPSGHLVAMATVALVIGSVVVTTRQPRRTVNLTSAGLGLLVALIALDRWVLSAHWISDLVGSLLLAAFSVALVLGLCGVRYLDPPWRTRRRASSPGEREAAIIYNPAKVGDLVTFRQRVEYELSARGWAPPTYFETTRRDPGYRIARIAAKRDFDLILGAGGDGTIREICSALAGTGVPMGLLPAGTTNLLARNLGISLDEAHALSTALDGERRAIDLVRIIPDGDESRATYLDVMGGVGIDAATFANTDDDLKAAIGHAAYAVTAARQWAGNPSTFTAELRIDDGEPQRVEASMITFGNVGQIQGGFSVLPGAEPDDGLLNVAVFSQASVRAWLRLATDVVARRGLEGADEHLAHRVELRLDSPVPFELDGDVLGECRTLVAECVPGALEIMLPPRPAPATGAHQA